MSKLLTLLSVLALLTLPVWSSEPAHGQAHGDSSAAASSHEGGADDWLGPYVKALPKKAPAWSDDGQPAFLLMGEVVTAHDIEGLSDWQLMDAWQKLTGKPVRLTEIAAPETGARSLLMHWLEGFNPPHHSPEPSPFDTALVRWDTLKIQKKNSDGEWYVSLDRRDIIPSDIPDLSVLELKQALEVLTNRWIDEETILRERENFRKQLEYFGILVLEAAAPAEGE